MTHLDLFSGIGGFALAAKWCGIETLQFVEIDAYCQKVLAKHWPGVPIHDDIRTYKGRAGAADLITGGFPCQPVSCAGKRLGAADDRWLWPEMVRVVGEVRPRWVLGENVPGIIGMGLDGLLADLEGLDYEVQTLAVPACAVGAPHRRMRIWIVAHTLNHGHDESERHKAEQSGDESQNGVPNRDGEWWSVEPDVGRVADGIPARVDRLRALGNAIAPQVAHSLMSKMVSLDLCGGGK